ncbi:MAG: hypothetical protein ACKOA8_01350 [Deltaproteobacteria bacterium]
MASEQKWVNEAHRLSLMLLVIIMGLMMELALGYNEPPQSLSIKSESAFDKVIRKCFQERDWQNEDISVQESKEYTTYWYDVPGNILRVYPYWIYGVESLNHFRKRIFSVDYDYLNSYGRMELFAKYIDWQSQKLKQDEQFEFRRACMALCVSANYIKYNWFRLDTKLGSMSYKVRAKEGDCSVFSEFASYLAGLSGIKNRIVVNTATWHVYLRFDLNGTWYYAEPQNDECTFMKVD